MNHQAWQLPCGRSNPLNVGNTSGQVDCKSIVARCLCDTHSSYTNSVKMTMQKTQMARTEVKLINVNKKDNYIIEIVNICKRRIRKTHNQRSRRIPRTPMLSPSIKSYTHENKETLIALFWRLASIKSLLWCFQLHNSQTDSQDNL